MKRKFRISLNNKVFEVEAEMLEEGGSSATSAPAVAKHVAVAAPVAAAPVPAAAPAPVAVAAGAGDVPSPLAGKVVSIVAAPGTAVSAGQTIMILEAMKMNTEVTAPAAGTVKAVYVNPGDGVEEGQRLMSIA